MPFEAGPEAKVEVSESSQRKVTYTSFMCLLTRFRNAGIHLQGNTGKQTIAGCTTVWRTKAFTL